MFDPQIEAEATISSPFWHGKTTRFHHVGCPGVTGSRPARGKTARSSPRSGAADSDDRIRSSLW
jgi:hypothetical protein